MPTALITGITGQDGAYLARFLLNKGYQVAGTTRGDSTPSLHSLEALDVAKEVRLLPVDFTNTISLAGAIAAVEPDELYHLAAQTSVAASFREPTMTGDSTGLGTARLLQALRTVKPSVRFFQASSSEMYGKARETPQTEETPFYPRSPYGAAKVYAHCMTINYRESYGLHASCGILFNHESPLRPEQFVTRKVTQSVARIKQGLQSTLSLGNLDVERDWGFAGDYVEAMWLMLQQEQPDDYIMATGRTYSLREFVKKSFESVGLNYLDYVQIDPAFFRPAEVNTVIGNPAKAKGKLGWEARMSFDRLVEFLVDADMKRVAGEDDKVRYWAD
jgi:GDPmannose 4,6-dehydratase